MDKSTKRFLDLMEKQNQRIAALARTPEAPEPDQFRLQREQERRDKWGQLRARERRSHRPGRGGRNVFGHTDLS